MKRFSFINAEGEVVHTLTCGATTEYISGNTYGDYLAIEIPNDSSVDFSYYHSSIFGILKLVSGRQSLKNLGLIISFKISNGI